MPVLREGHFQAAGKGKASLAVIIEEETAELLSGAVRDNALEDLFYGRMIIECPEIRQYEHQALFLKH